MWLLAYVMTGEGRQGDGLDGTGQSYSVTCLRPEHRREQFVQTWASQVLSLICVGVSVGVVDIGVADLADFSNIA